MKNMLYKVNFWNFFIGLGIGFALSICVFSALVPSGLDMIRLYHLEKTSQMDKDGNVNMDHSTTTAATVKPAATSGNPYMMGKITSEKQFVQQMKLHHEAAVLMAQQVLKLNPRGDIRTLANNIISSQTTEIKIMKDWLANWK